MAMYNAVIVTMSFTQVQPQTISSVVHFSYHQQLCLLYTFSVILLQWKLSRLISYRVYKLRENLIYSTVDIPHKMSIDVNNLEYSFIMSKHTKSHDERGLGNTLE